MFVGFTLLLSFLSPSSTSSSPADGRVWDGKSRSIHEWGTFVSVQGSDGIALDGLRHHDRDLPPFVYDLAQRGGILALQLKMETPVVYFYAPGTWRLDLDVRFPHGLVTQWWPTAERVNEPCARGPEAIAEHCARAANLKDGFVSWGRHDDLVILPPGTEVELLPVADDDPWGFARAVAANPLRVACAVEAPGQPTRYALEHERLLFYRGLGDFALPLAVRVRSEERRVDERAGAVRRLGLDLALAPGSEALRGLFVIDVEGREAGFTRLGDLAASRAADVELALRPKADATAELVQAVAAELERAGLFGDEALAMARTWQHAWFGDEGLRVLYVLPETVVERELPLSVSHGVHQAVGATAWDEAPPESIVRVFVARTEVLTPSFERVLRDTVKQRADGDAKAADAIAAWGRFAEPWLERVRVLESDPALRSAAEALLREVRARP